MVQTYTRDTFCNLIESGVLPSNVLITMYDNNNIIWYGKCIDRKLHLSFDINRLKLLFREEILQALTGEYIFPFNAVRKSYPSHSRYSFHLSVPRFSKTKPL